MVANVKIHFLIVEVINVNVLVMQAFFIHLLVGLVSRIFFGLVITVKRSVIMVGVVFECRGAKHFIHKNQLMFLRVHTIIVARFLQLIVLLLGHAMCMAVMRFRRTKVNV